MTFVRLSLDKDEPTLLCEGRRKVCDSPLTETSKILFLQMAGVATTPWWGRFKFE